ncbi:hypothetical protein LH612_31205, partial [Klebsiella pneumoniae]|nr:hypothetical protein [Klebsiella pneumoniae]
MSPARERGTASRRGDVQHAAQPRGGSPRKDQAAAHHCRSSWPEATSTAGPVSMTVSGVTSTSTTPPGICTAQRPVSAPRERKAATVAATVPVPQERV